MIPEVRRIIARTIGHEGNYVNHPNDKGGETKYGISKRSYPNVDIKNLTEEEAYAIYERDFYNAVGLNRIASPRIRWKVFDIGVNCYPKTAVKMLQRAVGVTPDGLLGPMTAHMVSLWEPSQVLERLVEEQKAHYGNIILRDPTQKVFFRGWMKRADDTWSDYQPVTS